MTFSFKNSLPKPIYIFIAINIVAGLFIFRNYGLTWDEPYFYDYGDALGYAYSPTEWFSGHFDLYNSYGASGDDHKNRGPAYLFLARNIVYGLEALGSDSVSAWHLVNFLFFQLGIYFLYRFAKRWMDEPSAFLTAVFFTFQPLVWGHAFINPKDPPFMTFFLASVCLGFELVDAIAENTHDKTKKILLAAFFLGITTSIRVLGPFAGFLVFLYFLSRKNNLKTSSAWKSFIAYGFMAILVMFVTWPFLWEDPLNLFRVFLFMSDNPTQLPVLFGGEIYRAGDLPRRYMPFMLATTSTEPTFPLFIIGLLVGIWKFVKKEWQREQLITLALTLFWFALLVTYVLIRKPAMYDGIRHFLFILPPVFILLGLGIQFLMEQIQARFYNLKWLHAATGIALVLPGVTGIIKLHPFEYAYYNSFVAGTGGIFREYETEYWLTCYKEAVEALNNATHEPVNLFVKREAYIAANYANDNINVRELRGASAEVQSGDYILINTRTNEDESTFSDAPVVIQVEKDEATFCIVREIP